MSQQHDSQSTQHQSNHNAGRDESVGLDNTIKDPDDWTTGEEPMTGAQRSYLDTLAEAAHVSPPGDLSKADASKMIDELKEKAGRGR